ncbi:MAG: hypothetical protein KKA81_14075 [Bacteroidetes bacterium]|nr:hypothetical protein [Bacteroidota bacterium]
MKAKPNIFRLTIPFIILICTWISSNFNWSEARSGRIIQTDGTGYYAYLPAIFIYQDLNFSFFNDVAALNYHENHSYDYRYTYPGHTINKYYCGTAIAIEPFFLLAHLITILTGNPADGYSVFYMISVNIAALFYLAIGLVFLRKMLKMIPGASEGMIALILLVTIFGTNIFYYTVEEPSMSHVYSFGLINLFLWLGFRYFDKPMASRLFGMAILLGIIVLVRPVNGLILLLVPFTALSSSNLNKGLEFLYRKPLILFSGVVLFLLILSIQLIIYKIQTGNIWVYSYGEEGFNFHDPQIINFLFSYRKGLFIYTPVFLLSLAGGYFLYKENKSRFFILAGFLIILIYVLSSWWQWYYGGSFSQRVMIEFYAIPALLLGYFLFYVRSVLLKRIYIALIILLLLVNIVQTEQYRIAQIHWSEMNKEKYWKVFLRVDKLITREKSW